MGAKLCAGTNPTPWITFRCIFINGSTNVDVGGEDGTDGSAECAKEEEEDDTYETTQCCCIQWRRRRRRKREKGSSTAVRSGEEQK
jgi:hypothetical protein